MRERNGPTPRAGAPSQPHQDPDAHGPLVLIGGACTPQGEALGAFIELAGEVGGPIIGITEASENPAKSAKLWREDFRVAGVQNIEFVRVKRDNPKLDRELAARIDDAGAIFLGGGNQVKLVAELSGSQACASMKALSARGGVICGTSAGAAALTSLTMAGGEIDEEGNLVEQYLGPGFGLLNFETIVDTHFSKRRRLQRLHYHLNLRERELEVLVRGEESPHRRTPPFTAAVSE
ncbi:MAG: cyanophycinase [Gemmatimonadetes bacterium]|nr:cyanophycinase [Gemmatimonadota bacterium]